MSRLIEKLTLVARNFAAWAPRRWIVATITAIATYLIVAVPTDLVDTPFFAREVPPTPWSIPVLAGSSVLAGLLMATYVASPLQNETGRSRRGILGAILTFFAVGCPVCNKLVIIALGSSGAMQFFEPVQPLIAVGALVLLTWALLRRVMQENQCLRSA